ncbi:MAG: dephospho-CoA kinase [Oscillospiraceae bacterium]
MKTIYVVGLTGQTGAGKSSVSQILRAQGIPVIDCDAVARHVVDHEKECLADLALEFSISILNIDGTLNRRKLGSMVFGNPKRLEKLDGLIFPYIRREVDRRIAQIEEEGGDLVVLDAPTLFEAGVDGQCNAVVSVLAPESLRLNRIMVRDHLSDDEARRRIDSQQEDNFYASRSQVVICNDGRPEDLETQTLAMLAHMRCHREADE